MASPAISASCAWCSDDFQINHIRRITKCCGLAIGDSCIAEAYDENDACFSCSAPRSIEEQFSIPYEAPVHIRRFLDQLDESQLSDETVHDGPHDQVNVEATQSNQAREWVEEALDLFIQVWKMEAQKLPNEDRQTIIIRAQNALSDELRNLTTRPTPTKPRPVTPESQPLIELTGTPDTDTTVTTATTIASSIMIPSTTASSVDYISTALISLKFISPHYAHNLCEDCKPMKRRIVAALRPGPHVFDWNRDSCRLCGDVRKAVRDAANLSR